MSAMLASSGADVVGNCTGTAAEFHDSVRAHFDGWTQQTFGQIAESFMFNIMSNSIKYRENIYNIQEYEAADDNVGIYQEVVAFVWETILFENLDFAAYGLGYQLLPSSNAARHWDYMSSLSDDYRLPPDFGFHSYAFFSGLFDRYTDFFEPNTKMRFFQSNFTYVEQMLERIEELNP